VRVDSAFFSEATITTLAAAGGEFTLSVPFERFVELKQLIEARRRWRRITADLAYSELAWTPTSLTSSARFVCVRKVVRRASSGPCSWTCSCRRRRATRSLATNKTVRPVTILAFHNGRGAQEGLFAELN
jgi:hypothetical protein